MAFSFEIFRIHTEIRSAAGSTSSLSLETTPETENFLDTLLEPFGRHSLELFAKMNRSFEQSDLLPWAIIAFEREYQLAGHVSSARKDPRDVPFGAYSIRAGYSVELSGPPPVSLLFFREKSVAANLASHSPLFSACWSVLADRSQDKHWLCIPEPLPKDWVTEAEKQDAALFFGSIAT